LFAMGIGKVLKESSVVGDRVNPQLSQGLPAV
jgi:hypothetical protein